MHCWCLKDVCSIIFIMRHVAGLLFDGIRRVLRHVRSAICKCVALRCFYHAESLCSLALNLSAVQSTLKVSETDVFCSNLSLSIEDCCTRRHLDCDRKKCSNPYRTRCSIIDIFQFIFLSNRNENIFFSLTHSRIEKIDSSPPAKLNEWENLPHKLRNFTMLAVLELKWNLWLLFINNFYNNLLRIPRCSLSSYFVCIGI